MTQKGKLIYDKNAILGKSHSLLFLKINPGVTASQSGKALFRLWEMFSNLEKGIVDGLSQTTQESLSRKFLHSSRVWALMFLICRELNESCQPASKSLGNSTIPFQKAVGPVIDGITLNYARDLKNNYISSDHIIVQFTGDNEFVVTRPIVESSKIDSKTCNGQWW